MKYKIFLINLDKSTDRLQTCQSQLQSFSLSCERLSAVYGLDLSPTDIETIYPPSQHKNYHKELSVGELGCYLSHRKAWQKIIDDDLDFAIILEDDFTITNDPKEAFSAITQCKQEWDYIKLAEHSRKRQPIHQLPAEHSFSLVTYDKIPARTCAQAVSKSGAQKLLKHSETICRPVDIDLQFWWEKSLLIFGLEPYLIVANDHTVSEIDKIAKRNKTKSHSLRRFYQQLKFKLANAKANKKRLKQLN